MMKKRTIIASTVFASLFMCAGGLIACDDNSGVGGGTQNPTQLAAPTITLNENVVSWQAVEHATSYDVTVGSAAAVNTTDTSYTLTVTEEGEYKITVIAKSTDANYTASAKSNEVVYTYEIPEPVTLARLEKVTDPAKTTYFLDEKATELDMTGATFRAVYSNDSREEVTPTLKGTVDLSTVGEKEVTFEYGNDTIGKREVKLTVTVKERTAADLDAAGTAYATAENEYGADKYFISDKEVDGAVDMKGNALTVIKEGGKSYIAGNSFASSGAMLVKTTGASPEYINVIAAKYITNAADLRAVNDDLAGYYILRNDITLEGTERAADGSLTPIWAKGFTPIGKAPIKEIASEPPFTFAPDGDDLVQEGAAFTGTFDGRGYIIGDLLTFFPNEQPTAATAYYLGMFGYIGKTGTVKNFTMRSSMVRGGNLSSFVAGVNMGTVENVVIDESCALFGTYMSVGGFIAGYNGGTVKNCVSYATNFGGWNSASYDFAKAAGDASESASETNVFIADKTDKTAELGDGWLFIDGYGTVYANSEYRKVLDIDKTWYVGQPFKVKIYTQADDEVSFATWGIRDHDNADNPAVKFKSYDPDTRTYTMEFAQTVTSEILAGGNTFVTAVRINGSTVASFGITVGAPYITGITAVATQNIECVKDGALNLGGIDLTVEMSDGASDTVNPTEVRGLDSSTVGEKSVTFVWSDGTNEYTVNGTVKVVDSTGAITASVKQGVDKVIIPYLNGWKLANVTDWSQFFDVSTTDYTVTVTGSLYGEVTFTVSKSGMTSATVTVDTYLEVNSKESFAAINNNLAGWYAVTGDIDFGETGTVLGLPPTRDESASENGWFIDLAQANGNAFTGKFDGQSHTLRNWKIEKSGWQFANYYGAMFAYIGTGAYVGNFTVDKAAVSVSQDASVVSALNCGTIDKVTVNANCTVNATYGRKAVFAIVNNGNITDYVNSIDTDVVYSGTDYTSTGTATPAAPSAGSSL